MFTVSEVYIFWDISHLKKKKNQITFKHIQVEVTHCCGSESSTHDYSTWVGAQNLKKPADSSDWRQKLWKSRQATAIMWRHNTVVHDYSGTRYSGTIPITGPYENPFSYYINPIKCAWI